ncbi:TetR/AcrR family transcriptional regulator [Paraburkholderia tropica]|uniref:TetR/AcrR family transcriptional regulator n=1 Tax=Paraburkholderia tropica TaxID=92647 RepID=UPI002AB2F5C8|nr:TetR/AcrR family transcriptional regulator [Paraburkholderia tropica]
MGNITMVDVKNRGARGRPRAFDRDVALERAMNVFWAVGFEGASIPMLTVAMGISAQSLYAAFESKEALYREAMERYGATIGGFGARALQQEDNAVDAMMRLFHDAAIAFSQNPATPGCMITMAQAGPGDDALTEYGRRLRAEGIERATARLERGKQEGQVRTDVDSAAWARYITSVVQGLSIQARDAVPLESLLSTAEIASRSLEAIRR